MISKERTEQEEGRRHSEEAPSMCLPMPDFPDWSSLWFFPCLWGSSEKIDPELDPYKCYCPLIKWLRPTGDWEVAVLWYIFFLCLLFFKEIGLYTL
jgi:hypothetical protein